MNQSELEPTNVTQVMQPVTRARNKRKPTCAFVFAFEAVLGHRAPRTGTDMNKFLSVLLSQKLLKLQPQICR